ncbi:Cystathionine beta-lyase PatB [compost metagenome]
MVDTEGTYLFWVDFNELGMEEADLEDFITEKAGLWLDGGTMFGPEGKGFQRFNLACPKSTLLRALNQLRDAINSL